MVSLEDYLDSGAPGRCLTTCSSDQKRNIEAVDDTDTLVDTGDEHRPVKAHKRAKAQADPDSDCSTTGTATEKIEERILRDRIDELRASVAYNNSTISFALIVRRTGTWTRHVVISSQRKLLTRSARRL